MDLHVSLGAAGDRTARIYVAVREAVLDGRLSSGERVPATRDLAGQLGVSRGTVSAAYDRLVAEGFLESRVGSGTFVTAVSLPSAGPAALAGAAGATQRRARLGAVRPLDVWAVANEGPDLAGLPPRGPYDLSVGVPDPRLFPLAVWRRMVSLQLRRPLLTDTTYDGRGHAGLRNQVARHLGLSRSVVVSGDDVVITVGAQQAIDLAARVLVEPGTVVAVEDPGYSAVHRLLETHRAAVVHVPVDGQGLVVDALPDEARVVYVTPSHQFPTGVPLSLARRAALLQWAARHDAVVIEDDYDSEYRYSDRPLEPLQSLDRDGRVVYVGTFSKSLLPVLRVGYLVPPQSLKPALLEAKRVTMWEGDVVTQGALAELIAEGHHAAHLKRATKVYRERRAILLEQLATLDDRLRVVPSVAGLHVCALLRDPAARDGDVVRRAAARGVVVEGISHRSRRAAPVQGLVLGIGSIDVEAIPGAVRRLAGALGDSEG